MFQATINFWNIFNKIINKSIIPAIKLNPSCQFKIHSLKYNLKNLVNYFSALRKKFYTYNFYSFFSSSLETTIKFFNFCKICYFNSLKGVAFFIVNTVLQVYKIKIFWLNLIIKRKYCCFWNKEINLKFIFNTTEIK